MVMLFEQQVEQTVLQRLNHVISTMKYLQIDDVELSLLETIAILKHGL